CPVVGTTNSVLPPNHPEVDLAQDGQTCPVVGAKTDHHHELQKHPSVPIPDSLASPVATECPALKDVVKEPKSKAMDDEVCPVIGPATTILPPDHPDPTKAKEGDVCPVTKAQVGHHLNKVHVHPSVEGAAAGAACPVTG
ncbi:hypothetical protein BDV96DRAFT_450179, partial [Lophiotrema nucula]